MKGTQPPPPPPEGTLGGVLGVGGSWGGFLTQKPAHFLGLKPNFSSIAPKWCQPPPLLPPPPFYYPTPQKPCIMGQSCIALNSSQMCQLLYCMCYFTYMNVLFHIPACEITYSATLCIYYRAMCYFTSIICYYHIRFMAWYNSTFSMCY